ncbi:MAG TPA: DUF3137 domain-containing protein [Candidatus Limnocylindrales bacterium]|nr:DUF3137 domain-containing protein [Candidatus Limnocylindrales bacterium]
MHTQMHFLMPFVVVAVLVVIVVSTIYGLVQARKRLEGLNELALRLGLNFSAAEDRELAERYGFLKQLAQGENRYAQNVLSGTFQQNQVLAFDFHYETYSEGKGGRQTHHHWFSFFILTLPAVFPDLTIRRENLFTKVAEAFGYQDIKFESAEFSKTFLVRSPDKKFAYDVCNAKMMEYLLANRDLSVEIENQVLALAFNTRLSVEQIEANLQRLVEIRSRLPEYLFTQNA